MGSWLHERYPEDLYTVGFYMYRGHAADARKSMYEIKSENDEIFISSATVEDVEIIDAITASRLKAAGNVVTSDEVLNTGVQSSESASTIIIGGDY